TYAVVEAAQPDYIRYAGVWGEPDDPYYRGDDILPPANTPLQWGYNKVYADAAFNNGLIDPSKDKQVIVAVLDTGVGYEGDSGYETDGGHEDLNNVTITGKNILNPSVPTYDDDITGGHGTNVAGIIAADTNNDTGIAGTAYIYSRWTVRVYIMPVNVLDEEGAGYDSAVYSGVKWAVDNGAKILNYSFGGHAAGEVMQNAVNYAYQRGCINIAAAGNEGAEAYYPAAYSNVISVASTGEDDSRSSFSNYGKIDVSAPGEQIWSAGNASYSNYTAFSGTSFSAPFVSGLAALIELKFDGLSSDDIRNIIEQTADDTEAQGYDEYTGWGRVNAYRALKKEFNAVGASYIKTYSWPNPFSPDEDIYANITFALDEIKEVSIEIYDASGDVVFEKTPDKSALVKGMNIVKWNGRNQKGEKAASGVYFYLIKDPKIIGKNKIAVLY
ncbi:MAG TPA: S8 family serine peptidase, partial [Spirochaetota bacterium]|nr:S8 family serine peptidase [Spirochaetota bacterium]